MSQNNIILNFLESIDTETVTLTNNNNNNNNNKLKNILDSITSDMNLTGGMNNTLSSTSENSIMSNKLNKLLNNKTETNNLSDNSDNFNKLLNSTSDNNMIGGNYEVDKLLSMLTTESSSQIQTMTNETSTESLENQLKQILNKDTTQNGGACVSCGHHIKNNDIRNFFTDLKSKGVKVDVKLNNQSMTEYFDEILQTTTDINTQNGGDYSNSNDNIQDGGANNKFSAAQAVRKDIAKEFNIPNGKDVVKIAFAVVKAVVEKTPSLANDADALSKAVRKHFEENKAHFKRML